MIYLAKKGYLFGPSDVHMLLGFWLITKLDAKTADQIN